MSTGNPIETWNTLQEKLQDAVKSYFPFEGKTRRLVLNNLQFDENQAAHDDIRSQEQAKMLKRTWGVPVYADVSLVDKVTGRQIDRTKVKLLTLPKPTNRYSYIVDGSEWQVENLWRLQAGVYAHIKQNREHEAEFNLLKPFAGRPRLRIPFDPESKQFNLKWDTYRPPLYPLLKLLGVDDEQMKKVWGEDIYKANVVKNPQAAIDGFYERIASKGRLPSHPDTPEGRASIVYQEFEKTRLLPDMMKNQFGKPIDRVNGEALLLGSKRILEVARLERPQDDRNSLEFKKLHGIDDFIHDRLTKAKTVRSLAAKIQNNLERQTKIKDIISADLFNRPVKEFFTSSPLSKNPEQINPLEMISNHRATTIMGDEGGIKSEHSVTPEMKLINPSHFGFLDPIHTPESERTGITLHLPIGIKKDGNDPVMQVWDLKEHKLIRVTPAQLHAEHVVLPDQVKWSEGKAPRPQPIASLVKMKDPKTHEVLEKPFSQGRYLVLSAHQFFDEATNLIPFLQNDQGNRTMTASRQGTQAVSLHHREAPMVQVQSGGSASWEKIVGTPWSHTSTVEGRVAEIKHSKENGHPESLVVQDHAGKRHEVQLYNNFPLNDSKTFIHSTPLVKVGDPVQKGQVLADTNFTKSGLLSLGTNLRVAYLPYKGYNFEDGIVISDSAAKKLTSEHLHRRSVEIDPEKDEMSKARFIAFASTTSKKLSSEQMGKLGTDGVVRVGQRVDPGDVLVAAVGRRDLTGDAARLVSRLSKKAFNFQDKSVVWDSDHAGEVVKVVKAPNGKGATVYVRTLEPAEVGDKIVGRHGNKAIITRILPDHEMPRIGGPEGQHVQVLMNPSGVPTRINLGQMLETAASKVSEKTGKPYMVNNFAGRTVDDYSEKVKNDLKKHNINDEETLYDASSKKPLGSVLTGNQYIFKLKHQVEKKLAVRGGGRPEYSYSLDMAPKGTGAAYPGQGIGQLEFYALLAHGARNNLREMASYKSTKHVGDNMDEMSHVDFWDRVRTNQPLPAPKPTFAYRKFEALLTGLGVNIHKDGNQLQLMPLTDRGVLALSHGEIKDGGRVLRGKDAKELEKGLFDPKITGGLPGEKGKGLFWSHISLAEPVPNPVFVGSSKAQIGPAVLLSGLPLQEFEAIARGRKSVNGKTGGVAINEILKNIDVKKELDKTLSELPSLRGAELNKANRKAKYLMALDQLGLKPHEAYMMNHVPVLPPVFRPIVPMPDGAFRFDDVNQYYRAIALLNEKLKNPVKELGGAAERPVREQLYDAMRAYAGLGGKPVYESNRQMKGILDIVAGEEPKQGYFQKRLMKRRQDLSMRSTIIPDPSMHLDYVGLPRDAAMELYKPFVVRELTQLGYNPMMALKSIKENKEIAWKALERALDKRPVLLKRDPALHKFSIMAFKPKLVDGKAVQIHPLVTAGYNADFDGDSIDLETPIPLCIEGKITLQTGRDLLKLLDAGDGNWVVETKNILAFTYRGWKPVKTVSFHEVRDKKKYRVTLKNGVSFVVSEDHSLMVHHEERKPAHLTLGVELDHEQVTPRNVTIGSALDDYEKGVAYGNFLGDGCAELRRQGGGRISIACLPQEERQYLMDIWRRKFDGNPSEYVYGFHVNGIELAKHFLETCGRYCDGKYVSEALLSTGRNFLKGLLAGYILSDGSVETTKSGSYLIRTWSRSKALRDGMSLVATMLGLPHSLRQREAKGEMNYIISFGKEAIKIIDYRCPGQKGNRIRQAREDYQHSRNDDRASQSERGFEIKSLEEVEYSDRMIDIEVDDESHVFAIQGGVIVHNTMSVFVPLTEDAVRESHKMFPSNNLFSPTHGGIMYEPTQEALLGLHLLTKWGKNTSKSFSTFAEAQKAKEKGQIDMNDVIKVGGKPTTLGRLTIVNHLPDEFKKHESLLHDPSYLLRKSNVRELLGDIAKKDPQNFAVTVDKLKDLGNEHSYQAGFSFGLKDLDVQKSLRSKILKKYDAEAHKVHQSKLPQEQKDQKLVDIYSKATEELTKELLPHFEKTENRIYTMVYSGARGSTPQFRQIAIAPMLMKDGAGRTIPTPVRKSYAEGLDLGDYWTTLHGARMGTLQKVEGTEKPGALTKQIANVMMPTMIVSKDCETGHGINLNIGEDDIHDRILASSIKLPGKTITAGEIITPEMTSLLKKHDVKKVLVRSPLKCGHSQGICSKCYGLNENGHLHEIGTNIGVIAGQSMGEPATQLAMDSFHTGGVAASRGAGAVDKFTRLNQLLNIPKTLPDKATLARVSGKVHKVEKDPATNGHYVWIGHERHYAPADRKVTAKLGHDVRPGDALTDGSIHPNELLEHTDIHRVQNYLTDELQKVYKDETKRRNIETVVRSLTNLTRILDPGDSEHLPGDIALRTVIEEHNKNLHPGETPIHHQPVLKGAGQVALDQHEDWMAKLNFEKLRSTILEGVARGWRSNIHGPNPVPAYAFGAEFGKGTKDKPHNY